MFIVGSFARFSITCCNWTEYHRPQQKRPSVAMMGILYQTWVDYFFRRTLSSLLLINFIEASHIISLVASCINYMVFTDFICIFPLSNILHFCYAKLRTIKDILFYIFTFLHFVDIRTYKETKMRLKHQLYSH